MVPDFPIAMLPDRSRSAPKGNGDPNSASPAATASHLGPLAVRAERQWRLVGVLVFMVFMVFWTARGPRRKAMETTALALVLVVMVLDRSRSAPKGNGDRTC